MTHKESLINAYVNTYKTKGYPPIAGRIVGLFYVSDQKYFTFQEIMDTLKISKSAASKALNFLLKIGEVNYIIKDDNKRKRHFFICIEGTVRMQKEFFALVNKQIELFEKSLMIRTGVNKELDAFIEHQIMFQKEITPFIIKTYKEKILQVNKD